MAHGFTNDKEIVDLETFVTNAISGLTAQVNAMQSIIADYWKKVYPVGSIYTSVNSTNPGTLFGGTWVRYGTGQTLVGVDTTQSEFNQVNKQGGVKTISYKPEGTNVNGSVQGHKLTIGEMPAHNHLTKNNANRGFATFDTDTDRDNTNVGFQNKASGALYYAGYSDKTANVGGDGSHNHGFTQPTFNGKTASLNNLQPYITVYFWRRTA